MKLKDKLEFLRAGYSRKEIEEMEKIESEESKDLEETKDEKTEETKDETFDFAAFEDRINEKIGDLIKTMQESNILTDGSDKTDTAKTGEDVIKDILGGKTE